MMVGRSHQYLLATSARVVYYVVAQSEESAREHRHEITKEVGQEAKSVHSKSAMKKKLTRVLDQKRNGTQGCSHEGGVEKNELG